jgi:hypothetical protein
VIAASSCQAVPILSCAALYFVDLRYLVIEQGTPSTLPNICVAALDWALGAPPLHMIMVTLATCAAAVTILVVGLWRMWHTRPDLVVLFAGVIVVFPFLLAVVRGSNVFYVRFFVVSIAFFLLVFSFVLADLCQRGPWGKTICVLLLLGYTAANGWHVASLFKYGRGHYNEAIRFIKEHSNQWPVTVGGDSDLRIGMLLDFYDRSPTGRVRYCPLSAWPRQGPEWVIWEKEPFQSPVPPMRQIEDSAGNRYEFVKAFPSAPLSGLHWFIYHKRAT